MNTLFPTRTGANRSTSGNSSRNTHTAPSWVKNWVCFAIVTWSPIVTRYGSLPKLQS